jgi:hypothetical protein
MTPPGVAGRPGPAELGPAGPPSFTIAPGEVARLVAAFQTVAQASDDPLLDIRARAAVLGADPAAALAFVRDELGSEQYPGVLRGAAGTLAAGTGNDLDKALLLGTLLGQAKHQVRYAHCSLSAVQSERRIAALFTTEAARLPPEPDLGLALQAALERSGLSRERSAEIVKARAARRAWLEKMIVETARTDLDLVRGALERARLVPAPAPRDAALLAEVRDHYWVQVEQDGTWLDLDPSATETRPGAALCAATQTYAELPAALYQTVTISVRNEYLTDGPKMTSETVLSHRVKVSDIAGQVLFLDNVGLPGQGGLLTRGSSTQYRPFLQVGDLVVTGSDFSIAPSGRAGGFADALGGGGESSEGPRLVAQWVDLAFEAPGRRSSVSRALLDFLDPDERATGLIAGAPDTVIVAAAVAQGCAIAVSAGRLHPAAVLQAAYGDLNAEAAGRYFEATGRPSTDGFVDDAAASEQALLGALAMAHAAAAERALAQLSIDAGPHVRLIRDQPFVAITNVAVRSRNDRKDYLPEISIDIRHALVRTIAAAPAHAIDAFWANVLRGLLDGAIERHLLETAVVVPGTAPPRRFDTSSAIQLARSQNIDVRAAAGAEAAELLNDDLSKVGGRRLARETGSSAIVTPVQPLSVQDEPRLALWAVNLETGHLLALLDTGLRGAQTAAERRLVELTQQLGKCLANAAIPLGTCRHIHRLWRRQAHIVLRDVPFGPNIVLRIINLI